LPYAADGPFAGIPFLIKDLILHAEGVPVGMGTRLSGEGITFPHDTDLMQRFKRAGLATLDVRRRQSLGLVPRRRRGPVAQHAIRGIALVALEDRVGDRRR
jgi:hypothetical protein